MRIARVTLLLVALVGSSRLAWAQEELTVTKIYSPSGTDLTLSPAGKDVLPDLGYDVNLGMLTKKYLTLHAAELWVETLVAQNTLATIGGRILVAPTTLLTSDLSAGATSMVVKHNNLNSGDRVYLEANGAVEFIGIAGSPTGSGPYTYSITRNLDGSGANAWTAGDAVLNTGQTGNGFIDLYSVRGVKAGTEIGPTIVGNVRQSTTYNDWGPRWAIGNLDGLYGYSGSTYGAAFGVPSGARVTVDATNGIRIYGGDNDQKVTIDTSGNATFDGDVTVGTGRNQIRNSECRVSTENWTHFTNTGLTTTTSFNLGGFTLNNESSTCYVTNTGTPANGTVTQVVEDFYHPVDPGTRYEASAYLNTFRTGNTHVDIQWLNDTFTQISVSPGNNCAVTAVGGAYLENYCRSGIVATAPATAFVARVLISTTHNGSGTDPYIFWIRAFFGEATTAQEDLTQWGPAGITEITNGLIKTDAINARTIAADSITTSELAADSVTSAKIVAGTIAATDIASGTITATQIASGTITGTQIAASTITSGHISVSTLSAISGNMGTLTAGSITGGTIDGATMIAGSGDEVTLNSSGISISGGTGTNNKIKWGTGSELWGTGSGGIFMSGNLSVEGPSLQCSGTNCEVSGDTMAVSDTYYAVNMPSSTGTTVIWETSCGCLKKQTSSLRYKTNVRPAGLTDAQRLLTASALRYDYRPDKAGASTRDVLGLSAEELYLIAPDLVNLDAAGRPDSIRQDALNVYLLQILKEQRAELDALKAGRGQR